jgi:hypothetical protein
VHQGAITFLRVIPTSLSDLIGPLGLRLDYVPLTDNVASLGEGESSYTFLMAGHLATMSAALFPFSILSSPFGDLYSESPRPL